MSAPSGAVGELWWHVHHDRLLEVLIEPAETRRKYVRENKPPKEVETRLRLFRPVLGKVEIPKYLREAYAKCREADATCREAYAKWIEVYAKWREVYAKWREADAKCREAYAKWREADAKWKEAYAKCREDYAKWRGAAAKWKASPSWKAVEALHAAECPNCPWNGRTIFP